MTARLELRIEHLEVSVSGLGWGHRAQVALQRELERRLGAAGYAWEGSSRSLERARVEVEPESSPEALGRAVARSLAALLAKESTKEREA